MLMKIVALVKGDERDGRILDCVNQIKEPKDELVLLHAVQVNGEVPLLPNGRILDFCTEFDLTSYENDAKAQEERMNSMISEIENASVLSLVGNPAKIVKHTIQEMEADFLISGAHITSGLEDLVSDSFTSEIIQDLRIPYLTVSSHGKLVDFSTITILSNEELRMHPNLDVFAALQERFDAKIQFVHLTTGSPKYNWEEEYHQVAENHGITNYSISTNQFHSIEEALNKMLRTEDLGVVAFSESHIKGWTEMFKKDNRIAIVNHIDYPIIIF